MASHLSLTPRERWTQLKLLQDAYPEFNEFLYDVITGLMGFSCTANQIDMADYLQTGPQFRMIQAQRGQAKTTVTAAYAVWRLIHDPTTRVLIVSSGDKMAKEISNWILQILNGMEELSCMLPDRAKGDRASVEAFDIHYILKGPEKSPSVACMGITGNMQGKRADVLIADDIESQKNSASAEMRERLTHLTRDFTSICSLGDIIYLGTPQSADSIYNSLPGRGYDIRIWPGRYPTEKEIDNYGVFLAPMIRLALEADPSLRTGGGLQGTRGQPTDVTILGEAVLVKKEVDQGAAYFQLQHMLDTRLSDSERFPLKISKILFMSVPPTTVPVQLYSQPAPINLISTPSDYPIMDKMYRVAGFSNEFLPFDGIHMYVDPAGGGQNGDETAYAVTKFSAGKVFLVAVGGVPGGLDLKSLDALTEIAVKWKPNKIDIEKNYGNGALSSVWQPVLFKKHLCTIEDVWESGQKELRIIDTMEPIIGSGRFIVDEDLIEAEWESTQMYPAERRASYSVMHQIAKITRDRGSLFHDDRLDAVSGSCRHWVQNLAQDDQQALYAAQRKSFDEMMKNPLGNGRPLPNHKSASQSYAHGRPSSLASLKRRW
jgi:hypothetical protein